ncbi:SsgA family sporulation/cell division regulator [Kitasatospora camelliae]|uniref:SsgA family sporulation/cell division regulator n=1 Tax=Kitasatospora camelliae TaxID=3156397 RepID=A0AAU8JR26_9ACTN
MPQSEPTVRSTAVRFLDDRSPDDPVYAELRYISNRPYTVCLAVGTSSSEVCWYFGRELLADGRRRPAGPGEIQVSPGEQGDVLIRRTSRAGTTMVSVPMASLDEFLAACYALVPAGGESDHLDLDADLERLLEPD